MAFGDEVNKYVNSPGQGNKTTRDNESAVRAQEQSRTASLLNFDDIGVVTSRDQIIDPYALVNIRDYRNNAVGQAQYNADLAQAQRYAELQEASYQEWYNSPEQVAIRERAAGRNPDLVETTGSEAVDTSFNETSPFSGIPTNQEIANQTLSSISGIVGSLSSVASLATSFNAIPLTNLQKELVGEQIDFQKLANIEAAEGAFGKGIMNRLSNAMSSAVAAGEAFDIDSWFSEDKNFEGLFESYGFADNVLYRDAFQRSREAKHKIAASSYDAATGTLRSQKSFAESLADPTYDPNVLIQRSFMEPVMEAEFELRKRRAEFEKQILDIKSQYAETLDVEGLAEGANAAAYQQVVDKYIADCELICRRAESNIVKNWDDMYLSNKDNAIGMAASYMTMNRGHTQWYEYLASSVMLGITVPNGSPSEPPSPTQPSGISPTSGFRHYGQNFYQFPGTMNFGN